MWIGLPKGITKIPGLQSLTEMVVNSSHHQAVDNPGSLTITGWAEDETIEVLEDPSRKFHLGVQWHPEMDEDKRLFNAFIKACQK